MKKILSIVLAVIMVFSMTAFASARSYNPYRDYDYDYNWDYYYDYDVYESYFADIYNSNNRDAIEYLYDMGILQGYGNGYYGPYNTLTRAEACAITTRMMVESYEIRKSSVSAFTDVDNTAWYREYVDTAHREGFMNGYGDGTFGPEDDVTYAQFATIVLNMLGYDCVNMDGTWPTNVERVARYLGLFDHIGYFDGDEAIYREDVAQMIYNALDCEMVYSRNGRIIESGETLREFIGDFHYSRYDLSTVKYSQVADIKYSRNDDYVEFKLAEDGLKETWTKCAVEDWDWDIEEGDWAKITYNRFGDVASVEFWRNGTDRVKVDPANVTGTVIGYDADNYIQLDGKGTHYIANHCTVTGVVEIGTMVTITVEDSEVVKIVVVEIKNEPVPEVTKHEHFDKNDDGMCDYHRCTYEVNHLDQDGDGYCDHILNDKVCGFNMTPGTNEPEAHTHEDANGNGICDFPGCTEPVTHSCVDANNDNTCDIPGCPNPNGGAASADPL